MATSTPNHGLYKYGGDDSPDLTKLGPSMDKIDLELKRNADNIGSLTNKTKIRSWNTGGDLLALFNDLENGEEVLVYAYNVTTAANWPASGEGMNTCRMSKAFPLYGQLSASVEFRFFMGIITTSGIYWREV